jgi:serine/threonine protein phosphatase PrpC
VVAQSREHSNGPATGAPTHH